MTNTKVWKALDSKLIQAAFASGEDFEKYLTRILGQEIPESWAKELGVPKGTTFAKHWKNKVATLTAEANKINNDRIKAETTTEDNWLKDQENAFKKARREGPISEAQIREWSSHWIDRGLDVPDVIKDYQTLYDRDATADRAVIEREMKLNPQNVTAGWLEQFHPESKDVAGLQDLVNKNTENIEKKITTAATSRLNDVIDDMNLRSNEKKPAVDHSLELIKKATLEKYYNLVDQGMPKDVALEQALNGPDGVLTDVTKNRDNSQYVMDPQSARAKKIRADNLKNIGINLAEIKRAKLELVNGPPKMWENEHIGGDYGKTMINEIITNLNKPDYFGRPWLALSRSKTALEYYNGINRGRAPTANGVYDLIDAQLKLNGHPGFYQGELEMAKENNAFKKEVDNSEEKKGIPLNPIKELSNLNFLSDNNTLSFDDKEGYSYVWKDVLRTLNFEGIDHFLEGLTQLNDSFAVDTGFWGEDDNLSFFNDDELFGEYLLND